MKHGKDKVQANLNSMVDNYIRRALSGDMGSHPGDALGLLEPRRSKRLTKADQKELNALLVCAVRELAYTRIR